MLVSGELSSLSLLWLGTADLHMRTRGWVRFFKGGKVGGADIFDGIISVVGGNKRGPVC